MLIFIYTSYRGAQFTENIILMDWGHVCKVSEHDKPIFKLIVCNMYILLYDIQIMSLSISTQDKPQAHPGKSFQHTIPIQRSEKYFKRTEK